jgi:asparagine synthase (glutamine-hydrolysing)
MKTRLDRILADKNAPLWALIQPQEARKTADSEMDWPWYGQLMKTPQTIAYLCQINEWLRHYKVDILF